VALVMETFLGVTVVAGLVVLIYCRVRHGFWSTGFQVPALGKGKGWGGLTPGDAVEGAREYIEGRTEVE